MTLFLNVIVYILKCQHIGMIVHTVKVKIRMLIVYFLRNDRLGEYTVH